MQRDYSRLKSWLPVVAENTALGDIALQDDPQILDKLEQYNTWAMSQDVDPLLANSEEFEEFLDTLQQDLGRSVTRKDVLDAIDRMMPMK